MLFNRTTGSPYFVECQNMPRQSSTPEHMVLISDAVFAVRITILVFEFKLAHEATLREIYPN